MSRLQLRVSYYRTDERTDGGEAIFHFRFYGPNGRLQESKSVPASRLEDELDELSKQGIVATRISV